MKKLKINVFNPNPKLNFTKSINLAAEFFLLTKEDRKRWGTIERKLEAIALDEAGSMGYHYELS